MEAETKSLGVKDSVTISFPARDLSPEERVFRELTSVLPGEWRRSGELGIAMEKNGLTFEIFDGNMLTLSKGETTVLRTVYLTNSKEAEFLLKIYNEFNSQELDLMGL